MCTYARERKIKLKSNMKISIKKTKTNFVKASFSDFEPFEELRNHFSVMEKNYAYIRRCKAMKVQISPAKEMIRRSCISASGEFEIGLLTDILKYCKDNFYTRRVEFELAPEIKEYLSTNNFELDTNLTIGSEKAKPRKYQVESMQIALNKQNGIFILGTGAGKTFCMALLIHNLLKYNLAKKILVICPFPDLAEQTFTELTRIVHTGFSESPSTFTRWYGKNVLKNDSGIIIAGSDILRSQYSQKKDILRTVDAIIVDEVHQLKASNKISDIISELPAKFRYGFTGTLPENKLDEWAIKGKIGPVRYNLASAELRKEKYLTNVNVLGLQVKLDNIPTCTYDEEGNKQPFSYQDEVEWLSTNKQLNSFIASVTSKLPNNTLILTNRLSHNDAIVELLSQELPDKKIFSITGEKDISERTEIRDAMEKEDNIIVVATASCFSTGISVKNIHNMIFPALIGKSNIRCIQSIGRILRLNANKTIARVIDIIPNTKYCLRHWEARKMIYTSEKIPFTEKIVKSVV